MMHSISQLIRYLIYTQCLIGINKLF